jgi:hypothetical protein
MNSKTSSFCGATDEADEAAVEGLALGAGGGRVGSCCCCDAAAAAEDIGSCCVGSSVGTGSRGGTGAGCKAFPYEGSGATGAAAGTCAVLCS